ncbi:unnamed protein product, partial [Trichogramma brassicae]
MKFSLLCAIRHESQESVSRVRISCASGFVSSSVRPRRLMTSFLIVTFSVLASETTLLLLPHHIYGGTKKKIINPSPGEIFAGYLQNAQRSSSTSTTGQQQQQLPPNPGIKEASPRAQKRRGTDVDVNDAWPGKSVYITIRIIIQTDILYPLRSFRKMLKRLPITRTKVGPALYSSPRPPGLPLSITVKEMGSRIAAAALRRLDLRASAVQQPGRDRLFLRVSFFFFVRVHSSSSTTASWLAAASSLASPTELDATSRLSLDGGANDVVLPSLSTLFARYAACMQLVAHTYLQIMASRHLAVESGLVMSKFMGLSGKQRQQQQQRARKCINLYALPRAISGRPRAFSKRSKISCVHLLLRRTTPYLIVEFVRGRAAAVLARLLSIFIVSCPNLCRRRYPRIYSNLNSTENGALEWGEQTSPRPQPPPTPTPSGLPKTFSRHRRTPRARHTRYEELNISARSRGTTAATTTTTTANTATDAPHRPLLLLLLSTTTTHWLARRSHQACPNASYTVSRKPDRHCVPV